MTLYKLLRSYKHRERLREIARVFFEEELGFLIGKINLINYLPLHNRIKNYFNKRKIANPPEKIRLAFEKLGPTFIKLGQLISLRPDLAPHEYVEEFEKMQDKVPPFPYSEAKKIIERELKKPIDKIFKAFPKTPIASASISQVYKAKLGDEWVAVKVQRPGIQEEIENDIEIMYDLVELLEKYMPEMKQYHLNAIVHEFEKWTLKEVNFEIEAYYAMKIASNFKNSKTLKIPKIYNQYTTGKVLTMEFLDGVPLHDVEALKRKHIDITKVIRNGYYIFLKQVFVDGFFHGDPHPGNLIILKDGKIGLIDFGILGHFDKKLKRYALDLFKTFIDNDPDGTVKVILRLNPGSSINRKRFEEDVRDIFEHLHSSSLEELQIGSLIKETLSAANKHGIEIPADFVLYGKTISILEGIAMRYKPDFNFYKETQDTLKKMLNYEFIAKETVDRTKDKVTEYVELVENFPDTANQIMDKVKKFKLAIDIEDTDLKGLTSEIERSSGNLALGLIIASLIVASALIMQTGAEKNLYMSGFIIGGALGLWLIKRTIFIKIR